MGGFTDWVEQVADSRNKHDLRRRVTDSESASMWQSLSYGANYKAAYCLAVCPAGEDVIAPFQEDRAGFVREIVKPLQAKEEAVYVVPGTDAEQHVQKRFPNKRPRPVGSGLRPTSIEGFLRGLPLVFQRRPAEGLAATYHFQFRDSETQRTTEATITIRAQSLDVQSGLHGDPDTRVHADARTWVEFVRGERGLLISLLRRRIRVRGSVRKLMQFQRCFRG